MKFLFVLMTLPYWLSSCVKSTSSSSSTNATTSNSSIYVKKLTKTSYDMNGLVYKNNPIIYSFSYNSDSNISSIIGSNGFAYYFDYNFSKQPQSISFNNSSNSKHPPSFTQDIEYNNSGSGLVTRTIYNPNSTLCDPCDTSNSWHYIYSITNKLVGIFRYSNLISGGILSSIDNIQYDQFGNIVYVFDNQDSTSSSPVKVINVPETNSLQYSQRDANICPLNNRIQFTVLELFVVNPLFYSFFSKEITNEKTGGRSSIYSYQYKSNGYVKTITQSNSGNLSGSPTKVTYIFDY